MQAMHVCVTYASARLFLGMATRPNPATARLRPPSTETERATVLKLNAEHVELLSPLDETRLALLERVGRVEVVDVEGQIAGFVVTVPAGTDYDSALYRWFGERYDDFLYLDRVVVDTAFRRQGVADAIYDQIQARAGRHGLFTLEVNSEPPNVASLAFHTHRGFAPVGEVSEGAKRTAMLAREVAWPESVRRMWAEDQASRTLGMQLDAVGPGHATVSMVVRDDMVNGHQIGHGGLTFTLADSAFACACNSHGPVTVAAGASVRFHSPVRLGETLEATAIERSVEGRRGIYDVLVRTGARHVATFEGHSARIDVPSE